VILAVAAAVSTPAHAGKIADAKAQASAAEGQLNDLYARSDAAVEAYNRAVAQLHAVRRAIAKNTVLLNRARRDLAAARAQLAEFVVSSYKGTGPSLTYYVLSASSFGDLVNRMDFVNRMSDTESLHPPRSGRPSARSPPARPRSSTSGPWRQSSWPGAPPSAAASRRSSPSNSSWSAASTRR
jgi:hypothetical protein